ncbi:hypothetical protein DFQ14_12236 [Halopolyspora algeriensis]|uniref:Small secreted domain DUF320 n=1 Tax=Halopolyspora algeriensis TaxID=1500506 RepID=A0A368VHK8_9ACTN|nr:hypothetical protein [Halopolyspora algeriensis]RCW38491.1 hypothetical protein DFQ14_12236 [Halopolyspora algeriensis]TQM42627.1 hypothetical protein FHU43_4264 [Halopolyspora algeriensis]
MGKKTYFVGALAATAGLAMAGTPAFADSSDNDGINIGNDNNVSVLPTQLCGNNIAVLGAVLPIGSPQHNKCVNAPIVDHPKTEDKDDKDKDDKDKGDKDKGDKDKDKHKDDDKDKHKEKEKPAGPRKNLPAAPTPEAVAGHAAVTG